MRARIRRDYADYYIGEVYNKNIGWVQVTSRCFTKWGANRELKKWKEGYSPKEFEL